MRYRLSPNILIKSENAAKPIAQRSKYLKALLKNVDHVENSLDFGCGKLRYFDLISASTNRLTICDSEIQLSRNQTLFGKRTSIRELLANSNNVTVANTSQLTRQDELFDRAFCINVLPIIPLIAVRKRVVRTIRKKLKPDGCCLFVVQYRNSDFNRMKQLPNAQELADGFLIDSKRGHSFYALIPPHVLLDFIQNEGLSVLEYQLNDGSIYLWAKPSP